MIISKFIGGLGNQLFQYATARALADRLNTSLLADFRAFRRYRLHGCLIDRFQVRMTEATPENLGRFTLPPLRDSAFRQLIWRLQNRGRLTFFQERGLQYHPEFHQLPDNTYVTGYWQCERYFCHMADQIRSELTRPEPVDSVNQAVLNEMHDCLPVSLHIRRGDYVSNPKTLKLHGVCSLDYYQEAARYVADRMDASPTFFVFSDDPAWTREHLKLPFAMRFVSHNPVEDPSADLMLMSRCQHHVIANSSFSWWGAWLNPAPSKIVVACRKWFADPRRNDRDLVPESWIRLGPE